MADGKHWARRIQCWGIVSAGLSVALGAFGAHALEGTLAASELGANEQASLLDTWEVAVRYQMVHALALLISGIMLRDAPHRLRSILVASGCFLGGSAIFSGCLYAYVLSGVKLLGAIVPIGGVAMIVGWGALFVASRK